MVYSIKKISLGLIFSVDRRAFMVKFLISVCLEIIFILLNRINSGFPLNMEILDHICAGGNFVCLKRKTFRPDPLRT